MTYTPKFTCPYCDKEINAVISSFEGDFASGILQQCDCKESRDAWELKHRMQMEQKKQRKLTVPATQTGRTKRGTNG